MGALLGSDFCLICAPCGYDEPEILHSEVPQLVSRAMTANRPAIALFALQLAFDALNREFECRPFPKSKRPRFRRSPASLNGGGCLMQAQGESRGRGGKVIGPAFT
jgi:hypothetical protein